MAETAQAVLHYLHQHPQFLAEHADALGIRLSERKILSFQQGRVQALKAKTEKMTQQLATMLAAAADNQVTTAKLLAFDRRLLAVNTVNQCLDAVVDSLKHDFQLPHAGVFVTLAQQRVRVKAAYDVSGHAEVMAALGKLEKTRCGTRMAPALLSLLPAQTTLESFLQLPVRWQHRTIALVLIGHQDAAHFQTGLATDFVDALAASLAVVLARLFKLPAA